jgi:hypothetical protein
MFAPVPLTPEFWIEIPVTAVLLVTGFGGAVEPF